jgi:uncharacterized pyridoxamine 5'-phosphate oxidase family protein
MSFQDVLAFVKQNPVCTLATIEGDQPRARGFFSLLFDDNAIYFTTGTPKDVYQQLEKNRKVELCYLSPAMKMLRIAGTIEFVDDRVKKQQLIEEKSYLKGFTADDPRFVLLRMTHGTARFWTLADNMREQRLPEIEF